MSSRAQTPAAAIEGSSSLRYFVFALFFIFGGITSLNDVVIPKLKALFTLSYHEAMFVQSAFFGAYLIVSIPASFVVKRFGYLRSAALGLSTMMAGCLLFVPAAKAAVFAAFLSALFVLAAGVTLVQVVANPLISRLGPPSTAHSRLTFAQAFNSLGTAIFPYFGALLFLGSLGQRDASRLAGPALTAFRAAEASVVARVYLGLALALAIVAAVVWRQRDRLRERGEGSMRLSGLLDVLRRPRLAFGALGIFLYVGAEVSIGSLIVSFLAQPGVLGLDARTAGEQVPIYWGGAMIGRFVGAWGLRRIPPGYVLAGCCAGAVVLLAAAAKAHGSVSGYSLLAVGLCNSIMFPTIFSLACEGLGAEAPDGSGVLCVAIVGGAVVPPLTGALADLTDLRFALLLPALCYLVILSFGVFAERTRRLPLGTETGAALG